MTKDKALRMALEVLEEMSHVNIYQNEDDEVGMKVCCDQVSYQPHSTDCQTMNAITSIKQALEQPEPEPEPVACIGTNGELMWLNKPKVIYSKPQPLYTSPPKRKPLTDDEIDALPFPPSGTATLRDFVRIIEVAHGIKGEA